MRAWGHPVWVRGDVTLAETALGSARSTFPQGSSSSCGRCIPRGAFTSTAGMRVADGDGLAAIVDEEQADAEAYERDHERIEDAMRHPWRTALLLLALGLLPAFAVGGLVFWLFGREVDTGYDREYEQEPPTETRAGARARAARARAAAPVRSSSPRRSST